MLLLAAKLAACAAARAAYGRGLLEQGYVAGGWRTAKLIISFFCGEVVGMSVVGVVVSGRPTGERAGVGAAA